MSKASPMLDHRADPRCQRRKPPRAGLVSQLARLVDREGAIGDDVLYDTTTVLTVPEAARRTGRNPETIRRWIREGKLRARKVGTQHVIEEQDLEAMRASEDPQTLPVPKEWGWEETFWGEPMPNVAAWVRLSRASR